MKILHRKMRVMATQENEVLGALLSDLLESLARCDEFAKVFVYIIKEGPVLCKNSNDYIQDSMGMIGALEGVRICDFSLMRNLRAYYDLWELERQQQEEMMRVRAELAVASVDNQQQQEEMMRVCAELDALSQRI